jgi:hypothetical protein
MSQSVHPNAHPPPAPVPPLEPFDALAECDEVEPTVAEAPVAEPLTAEDGPSCDPPEPSMAT